MAQTDKVALITGAGAGIGKAASLALARDGFYLVLTGRTRASLEETAYLVVEAGASSLVVPTDVADPHAIARLFATVKERFGRLDLLFNNVGVGTPAYAIEDVPYDAWCNVFQTTVNSTFLCTQEAIRIMKSQEPKGGRIINNGSVSAETPRRNAVAYTSAKHAITGLTKSTALDCRDYSIACGQINIGNAATEMSDRFTKGVIQANDTVTVEPTIDVEDVARAVAYMASLPLESNVLFMTVMATKMPFVGRG